MASVVDHDVVIAAITAATALSVGALVPLRSQRIANRAREREREQEYQRADELAQRTAATVAATADHAQVLLERNDEAARLAAEVQRLLIASNVHLRNEVVAGLRREHDAATLQMALLREIVDLRNGKSTLQTQVALNAVRARLDELADQITERTGEPADSPQD